MNASNHYVDDYGFVYIEKYVNEPIECTDKRPSIPGNNEFTVKDLGFVYRKPDNRHSDQQPEIEEVFRKEEPRQRKVRGLDELERDAQFYVEIANGILPTFIGKFTDRSPEVFKLTDDEKDRIIEDTVPVLKKYQGTGKVDPVLALVGTIATVYGTKYFFSKPLEKEPAKLQPPPQTKPVQVQKREPVPDTATETGNIPDTATETGSVSINEPAISFEELDKLSLI